MQTLIIKTDKGNQADLFEKLAKELGLQIQVINDDTEVADKQIAMAIAETSFSKDWNSKEDEHWDKFLKAKK